MRALAALAAAAVVACPASATAPKTLEQLVGQTIVTGLSGQTPSASLLARIRAGEVGGVVLFGRNIGSDADVARLVSQLQAAAAAGGNPAAPGRGRPGGRRGEALRRRPAGRLTADARGGGRRGPRRRGGRCDRVVPARARRRRRPCSRSGHAQLTLELAREPRLQPQPVRQRQRSERLSSTGSSRAASRRPPSTSPASAPRARRPTRLLSWSTRPPRLSTAVCSPSAGRSPPESPS